MKDALAVAISALLGFAAGMGGTVLLTRGGDEVVTTQAPPATALRRAGRRRSAATGPHGVDRVPPGAGPRATRAPGPSSTTTTNRYPPEVATAAWQACRDTYTKTSGIPVDQTARDLGATRLHGRAGMDHRGHGRPTRRHLRLQRDDAEVPTDGTPGARFRRWPAGSGRTPCVLAGEWPRRARPGHRSAPRSRRRIRRQRSPRLGKRAATLGSGSAAFPRTRPRACLVFPDCMAALGWIIVAMSGPPADLNAYNAAAQRCRPMAPATTALSGQVPQSTRSS